MADVAPDVRRHPLQRQAPPWRATLVAQTFLCVGLYLAFRVGAPREALMKDGGSESGQKSSRGISDIHFLSVAGGSRPISQQMQLLSLMNTAARIYNVKFVVCLTELGDNDALPLNATLSFEALRVPWLTTELSHKNERGYFLKQFKISDGKSLDVIGRDTRIWKGDGEASGNQQLNCLEKVLVSSNGTWHVVIGLHPLTKCGGDDQSTYGHGSVHSPVGFGDVHSHLSGLFLKHGVDLYISKQRCSTTLGYMPAVSYISKPGHVKEFGAFSRELNEETYRGPLDGFYLHRVGLLEIETYSVNLAGDMTSRHSVQHLGREI